MMRGMTHDIAVGGRAISRVGTRNSSSPSLARRAYLALPAAVAALLALGQMVVAAVDPYNVYPWSPVRPISEDAAIALAPHLVNAAARGGYDTVMIGGSTSMGFRPSDMETTLEGTEAAVNLSYQATRPADLGVVFEKIGAAPQVRRVLLSLDLVYLLPATARFAQFPFHLYDGDVSERLFRFDRQAYRLTGRLLAGGDLSLPPAGYAARRAELARKFEHWHEPGQAAREAAQIEAMRPRVGEATALTCAGLPAIKELLVPFAQRLAAAGKRLDVILPPYALGFYHWAMGLRAGILFTPDAPLERSLVLRRCVVEGLSGIPGARVFAFDGEAWITDDAANYHDFGHVYDEKIYRYMLDEVNAGRHQLTPAGFDVYAADLRRRVLNYSYQSSLNP